MSKWSLTQTSYYHNGKSRITEVMDGNEDDICRYIVQNAVLWDLAEAAGEDQELTARAEAAAAGAIVHGEDRLSLRYYGVGNENPDAYIEITAELYQDYPDGYGR